jgi:transposase
MEQLDYNLLFRWFVGLPMDVPVWDHSTFPKIGIVCSTLKSQPVFFKFIRDQAQQKNLISDEHFTVDCTLLEAFFARQMGLFQYGYYEAPSVVVCHGRRDRWFLGC